MFECVFARPGGEQAGMHCPPLLVETWGGALHAPARAWRKLREPPGREGGSREEAPLVSRVLHGDPPRGWRTEESELNPGTRRGRGQTGTEWAEESPLWDSGPVPG